MKVKDMVQMFDDMKSIDLSPLLENGIPRWYTHPPLVINPTCTHEHDGVYIQTIFMPEHIGSHVDAPAHALPDRPERTIETFPVDYLFGRAILYNIKDLNPQPGQRITKEQILGLEEKMGCRAEENDIVLLNYGWEQYWKTDGDWTYYALNEPGFSEEATKLFYERKVRAVASDTIACDMPVANGVSEKTFGHENYWLPNDILIIEGLVNLDKLPHECYFMTMPLKIKNGSGSPIRALAFIPK